MRTNLDFTHGAENVALKMRETVIRWIPPQWVQFMSRDDLPMLAKCISIGGFSELPPNFGLELGVCGEESAGIGTIIKKGGVFYYAWHTDEGFHLYKFCADSRLLYTITKQALGRLLIGPPSMLDDRHRARTEDLMAELRKIAKRGTPLEVLGLFGEAFNSMCL